MTIQAKRATAGRVLVATLALSLPAVSCSDDDGGGETRTSGEHVTLTGPAVQPVRSGDLSVQATFTWNACGDRACFAFDEGRHGGPDVFGISFDAEPKLTVTHATLTLRSSCGEETSITEGAVQGSRGVFFIVQDTTRDGGDGDACYEDFKRVYNMAAGTLEVLIDPPADCGGKYLFFDALFGHSYNEGGSDVRISPDGDTAPKIIWGDDSAETFTLVTNDGNAFDCEGVRRV